MAPESFANGSPVPLQAADLSSTRRHLNTLVLTMFAATAWILTHRYHGIWHDGVLYAGQAVFRLDRVPFANDLFFAYGSQDRFTVFTGIYALAIRELGLPIASAVLLAMAHVVWLAAAAWLLRAVLRDLAFWLALIVVAVLPATYGSFGIFSYGETFLTARIWSEAPALLAVACILRGYRISAITSLVFAVAMHPVIAFPAVLFVFFFGCRGRQQLVLAILGLAVLAILTAASVSPFTHLTTAMDPVWLDLSIARSPFVFLAHWKAVEYREPIFFALLLTSAALVSAGGSRRLWWSALGVFLAGMGLSLLAVYWPGVLLIQMQPWRVLWLTKILAVVAGVGLLQDLWLVSPYSRILLAALTACALTLDTTGLVCAVPLLVLIVSRHRYSLEPSFPPWFSRLAWGAILLLIGEKIYWAALFSSNSIDFNDSSLTQLNFANRVFVICKESGWFVFPSLLLGTWWLLHHRPQSRRWVLLVSGMVLIFVAFHWQRTGRNQVTEDLLWETGHSELANTIQPHHLTYWAEGLSNLWFIVHRGSYASTQQAAGIIFSRQTAIEADRRLARLKRLGLPDSRHDWAPKVVVASPAPSTNLDGLVHVCQDPILDFVVLPYQMVGTIPIKTIRFPSSRMKYHIYECAAFRTLPDSFSVSG